jgi:purine-binding chemotaxis protein CheW
VSAAVASTSVLAFRLEGREYAVPAGEVIEVVRMVAVVPVPEAPPWVCGVLNYRGRVIPVVDARVRLGLARRDPDLCTPIIVMQAGEQAAGVLVDEALDVLALPGGVDYPDRVRGGSPAVSAVASSRCRSPASRSDGGRWRWSPARVSPSACWSTTRWRPRGSR